MLSQLWPALERIPGQEAVLGEWRGHLGEASDLESTLLVPTDRFATAIPIAGDPYAHYRVVHHSYDDVVGMHSRGEAPVTLSKRDVVIYRLAIEHLINKLTDALGFDLAYARIEGLSHTYCMGTFRPLAGFSYPVFLTFPLESIVLRRTIEAIAAHRGDPFILTAPTRARLRPSCEALLSGKRSCFLALSEAIQAGRNGAWVATESARRQLSLFVQSAIPQASTACPVVFFPTPSDAAWSNLKITFRDRHTLTAKVGDVSMVLTYGEMGMADRRNKAPTKQWDLLHSFAEAYGHLTWDSASASPKNQKRREDLARNLQAFFRIDGDPIAYDNESKGWKTLFTIEV